MDYRPPVLRFRCNIRYRTPRGVISDVTYYVAAVAADLAVRDAEAILRENRKRRVGQIIYKDAVQC